MEHLWSPWRAEYVSNVQAEPAEKECLFCRLARVDGQEADESRHILHRGRDNLVVLNRFPYTSGHLMIAPYAHLALLSEADRNTTDELMELAKVAQQSLGIEYRPDGYNLGMNLGQAAGAGVESHFHLHVLPRWNGDTNFMSTVGGTRVMPEALDETFRKLRKHFSRKDEG
jgi:ATP adenylyltransferase